MTRDEWAVVVRTYNAFWPQRPMSSDTMQAWFAKLGGRDQRVLLEALNGVADVATFPPSIAEVLEAYRQVANRKAMEAPALPQGEATEGEILWQRLTPEQRRECVQAALDEEGPKKMAKLMGWTVDEPGPLILLGARWHAIQRYRKAAA